MNKSGNSPHRTRLYLHLLLKTFIFLGKIRKIPRKCKNSPWDLNSLYSSGPINYNPRRWGNWSWVSNDIRPMTGSHLWRKASLNSGFQKLTQIQEYQLTMKKSNNYMKNKPSWAGVREASGQTCCVCLKNGFKIITNKRSSKND